MTTTDLSALSTSQLAEQVTAVQQELTRRQGGLPRDRLTPCL